MGCLEAWAKHCVISVSLGVGMEMLLARVSKHIPNHLTFVAGD